MGYVYFIGSERAIKIGFSNNPEARMMNIQVGCPDHLTLMASIEAEKVDEEAFLRRFKKHRLRGEWFHRHEEIERAIEALRAGCPMSDIVGKKRRRPKRTKQRRRQDAMDRLEAARERLRIAYQRQQEVLAR